MDYAVVVTGGMDDTGGGIGAPPHPPLMLRRLRPNVLDLHKGQMLLRRVVRLDLVCPCLRL